MRCGTLSWRRGTLEVWNPLMEMWDPRGVEPSHGDVGPSRCGTLSWRCGTLEVWNLLMETWYPLEVWNPLQMCDPHEARNTEGNSQCVDSLLSHGADPNHQAVHLGSPLYVSCVHQHTACSKVLLARGACVNVGQGDDSPLHAAVRQDSARQVSLLLNYGADVNLRDENAQRPMDLARPGERIQQLLAAFQVSPRSLCHLCRLQIRTVIGRDRLKLLPLLPLPSVLTQYLQQMQDDDWPTCSATLM
ncbi:ankyrin repeat and SOCS box protein 5 [Nematolebias whitei]|uniref:ankyrin repeat and SOCS box protein 5 n=1 Tax=Nematolebias whitei TaxID=451745 RepID=UPI00189B1413|nr:ankyrin repeat and SOCS box protein 5 [Nematolebias whitei]